MGRRLIIPHSVRRQLDRLEEEARLIRTDPRFTKFRDIYAQEIYPVARAWILRKWWQRDPERAEAAFALIKGKGA